MGWWQGIREGWYVGHNYSEGRWWYPWWVALYAALRLDTIHPLICKMFGHKLEASAEGLEDCGGEDIWCVRCGWHIRVWH